MSSEPKEKDVFTAFDLVLLTIMLSFVRVINHFIEGNWYGFLSFILVGVMIILIYRTKLPQKVLQKRINKFVFYSYAIIVFIIATTYF